jgi:preprotein translocase subunit SecG
MSFLVGLFTFVLIIICLLLILLVLVQLPKKDAGAGLAFGGGTADALFGAGSGNALTKITKWLTVVFLVMALLLGYAQDKVHNSSGASDFAKQVQQKQMQTATPPPPAQPAPTPANNPLAAIPIMTTNVPATTNAGK